MEVLAKRINEEIKKSALYKRYCFLKEKVENNKILNEIKMEMELLKKDICQLKNEEKKEKYFVLDNQYKSDVLVKEYLSVKEELNMLLKDISDILSLN